MGAPVRVASTARGSHRSTQSVTGSVVAREIRSYWSKTPAEILVALDSRAEGLTGEEAAARLAEVGPNALEPRRRSPLVQALLSQAKNPLAWLLLFAAGASALAGEAEDAAIVTAV